MTVFAVDDEFVGVRATRAGEEKVRLGLRRHVFHGEANAVAFAGGWGPLFGTEHRDAAGGGDRRRAAEIWIIEALDLHLRSDPGIVGRFTGGIVELGLLEELWPQ